MNLISVGIKSLHEKPELVCKSFLVTGSSTNFNGAEDCMIQLETDIKMIFDNEDDDEVFHDFTA